MYFHKDYKYHPKDSVDDNNKSLKGVLYGHEHLPDDHEHKTIAHINVEGYNVEQKHTEITIFVKPKK